MAYDTANAPYAMTPPPVGGGFRTGSSDARGTPWYYQSTHATSDVRASGFVTNAAKLGMHIGDPVFVYDSVNNDMTLNFVSAISTAGAGTISSAST